MFLSAGVKPLTFAEGVISLALSDIFVYRANGYGMVSLSLRRGLCVQI